MWCENLIKTNENTLNWIHFTWSWKNHREISTNLYWGLGKFIKKHTFL